MADKNTAECKKEKLSAYLERSEYPFNYEQQTMTENRKMLEDILAGKLVKPLHFEFLPSERCNHRCEYCLGGSRKGSNSGAILEAEPMLRLIDELADYGVEGIVKFAGMSGEPLLNPGVTKAMQRGVQKGLKIGLITNGAYLTPDIFDYIHGSTYISVSLDAGDKETFNKLKGHDKNPDDDTYDRTLKNLYSLGEFKRDNHEPFRFTIGYIIHKNNFGGIVKATKLAKEVGADIIQFKSPYVGPEDRFSEEQISKLYGLLEEAKAHSDGKFRAMPMQTREELDRELRGNPSKADFEKCYAHNFNGVVAANGNLYLCVHSLYNQGRISGESLGNIYSKTFRQIWEGEKRMLLAGEVCPSKDCRFCNRFDHRMNSFGNFCAREKILEDGQ